MPYINDNELNSLYAASGQIRELIEGGAEDTQYYDGILGGLVSIIKKVSKERAQKRVRTLLNEILNNS